MNLLWHISYHKKWYRDYILNLNHDKLIYWDIVFSLCIRILSVYSNIHVRDRLIIYMIESVKTMANKTMANKTMANKTLQKHLTRENKANKKQGIIIMRVIEMYAKICIQRIKNNDKRCFSKNGSTCRGQSTAPKAARTISCKAWNWYTYICIYIYIYENIHVCVYERV